MKKSLLFLSIVLLCFACKKDNDEQNCGNGSGNEESDSLYFGHFYGECIGEDCMMTFKLSNGQLFEDTIDSYAGMGPFSFIQRSNEDYLLVDDLMEFIPTELMAIQDSTFGCPDCVDQGGLFVRWFNDGTEHTWIIDQAAVNPPYLVLFKDKVNDYIDFIND
jgi:hypothetical protein